MAVQYYSTIIFIKPKTTKKTSDPGISFVHDFKTTNNFYLDIYPEKRIIHLKEIWEKKKSKQKKKEPKDN